VIPSQDKIASVLGGQTVFVFFGYIFTFAVGLPLQIYVARNLGPTNLGVFSLLEATFGVVSGLLAFGLAPTVVKFIPQHLSRGEHTCIRTLVLRGAVILVCAGIGAVILTAIALRLGVPAWIGADVPSTLVLLMSLLIPLGLLNFFLQQGLRGFLDLRYVVLGGSVLQLSVKALIAVILIHLGFGLLGWVWATILAVFAAVLWMAKGLWHKCTDLPPDVPDTPASHVPAWRSFALVQYTGSLVGIGSSFADRFLLGWAAGAAVVGTYAVVLQLQSIPRMLLNMLLSVAAPMLSSANAGDDKARRQHIYHLTTDWSVRCALPLMIFVILFADSILLLYGPEFMERGHLALLIAIVTQTVNLFVGPIGTVLTMSGQERAVLRLSVYQQLIALSTLVVLVPPLGILGVVLSQACATIFINVAELSLARNRIGSQWWDPRYRLWLLPSLITLVAGVTLRRLIGQDAAPLLLIASLLSLVCLFHVVSLVQGLHDDDRDLLQWLYGRLGWYRA
jgi:O-antigen/teichoic acid export membrane protein